MNSNNQGVELRKGIRPISPDKRPNETPKPPTQSPQPIQPQSQPAPVEKKESEK
jgi:hypothetical protein